MKVIETGRLYELEDGNRLGFVRKENGRVVRFGTTNEEVLEVLLHRLTDAFERVPCQETIRAVYHLREALSAFERRTERRIASLVAGTQLPHDPLAEAAGTPMGTRPWPNMDALDAAPN